MKKTSKQLALQIRRRPKMKKTNFNSSRHSQRLLMVILSVLALVALTVMAGFRHLQRLIFFFTPIFEVICLASQFKRRRNFQLNHGRSFLAVTTYQSKAQLTPINMNGECGRLSERS